ncbi:uncharacterized protein LOC134799703 [Cydia splendana]|uniref:uncharacterized protein LOC134799703 n=1 Tax=Cydia splendana TaxID=1100963 RepID=UPI00300C4DA5
MLQKIQEDIVTQSEDMKNMEERIKETINKNIDKKFELMESKTNQLEEKIDKQQKNIDYLENKLRKKNLIFFGVQESEQNYDDLVQLILDVIKETMKIKCEGWEIENVNRIGKKSDRIRPIVTTFTTIGRKMEVLRSKRKLENSGIYIKEDYSPAVLQKRKELQDDVKREWEAGNKVMLIYDKMVTLKPHATTKSTPTDRNSKKRVLSNSPTDTIV